MKLGPKCSRSSCSAVIRFTTEAVLGCRKSVSPGSSTSDGASKSRSIPSNPYSVTICVTEFTKLEMLDVGASVKYSPPPPSEISTFFPRLFSNAMSSFICPRSMDGRTCICIVPSGAR